MKTVNLVERIEGEAKLNCSWKNGIIIDSRIDFLNFRGFEYILEDKSPLDALVYTPRICGICGQAHLNAAVEVLEKAYENIGEKLEITPKAKLLRQIGLNIEMIDSHLKWFYMFILPDIIKLNSNDLNIYEPLKGKKWLEACKVASETIKALAIIAGQWPHSSYMIPGGVMSDPTKMDLINMQNYLQIAINFFEDSIVSAASTRFCRSSFLALKSTFSSYSVDRVFSLASSFSCSSSTLDCLAAYIALCPSVYASFSLDFISAT